MSAALAIEITGFAIRACEAPLTYRQEILRVTGTLRKLTRAAFLLPIVYFVAWFMILLSATLAIIMVRLEKAMIRKYRGKLAASDSDFLRAAAERIKHQLPQLQKLAGLDKTLRPLSPTYRWLLLGFDEDLRGFILAYETILEEIQGCSSPRRSMLEGQRRTELRTSVSPLTFVSTKSSNASPTRNSVSLDLEDFQ